MSIQTDKSLYDSPTDTKSKGALSPEATNDPSKILMQGFKNKQKNRKNRKDYEILNNQDEPEDRIGMVI